MTWILLLVASLACGQRQKIVVDQDARGPATTDTQSILMFAQSSDVDVLGVTIVTGDQWANEEALHALRALEIAGRQDIPVFIGADRPLINTKEESEVWESRFGELSFKGAWSKKGYHDATVIPELPEGMPSGKVSGEHAVDFIIRMVHKYPGEVTIWAGGPLTNIALAVRKDPDVAGLAKQLVLMGGGFNVSQGGIQRENGRREFNWWFDPEAVRIVMSEPWKHIAVTGNDVSVKTRLSPGIQSEIAKAGTPLTEYLQRFSRPSYMWDEISAAALLDHSVITEEREMYVNIDIDHGAGYGQTIFVGKDTTVPSWWRLATVQLDVDTRKLYDLYTRLMTEPPGSGRPNGAH